MSGELACSASSEATKPGKFLTASVKHVEAGRCAAMMKEVLQLQDPPRIAAGELDPVLGA